MYKIIPIIIYSFCLILNAYALPITNGLYIGGIIKQEVYVGEVKSNDLELSEFDINPNHFYMDTEDNVNLIMNEYNQHVTKVYNDVEFQDGSKEGNIILDTNLFDFDYISLKWDGAKGGWFIWDISNISYDQYFQVQFEYSGLSHDLSHMRYWKKDSSPPVPEPSTMLLIGCGLIGMAKIGKNINKN